MAVEVLYLSLFALLVAAAFSALTLLVGRQQEHPACKTSAQQ